MLPARQHFPQLVIGLIASAVMVRADEIVVVHRRLDMARVPNTFGDLLFGIEAARA